MTIFPLGWSAYPNLCPLAAQFGSTRKTSRYETDDVRSVHQAAIRTQ